MAGMAGMYNFVRNTVLPNVHPFGSAGLDLMSKVSKHAIPHLQKRSGTVGDITKTLFPEGKPDSVGLSIAQNGSKVLQHYGPKVAEHVRGRAGQALRTMPNSRLSGSLSGLTSRLSNAADAFRNSGGHHWDLPPAYTRY